MTKVAFVKADGAYHPLDDTDAEELGKIGNGEVFMVDVQRDRNVDHHKKGFVLLDLMYSNQDEFDNREHFRSWVSIQLGMADAIVEKDGAIFYKVRSWDFSSMNQSEFDKLYALLITFAYEKMGIDEALAFT